MQPITVIIPTYNRARSLEVVWQSYIGNPLVRQIIVVNDGSTDNTKELLARLAVRSSTPVKVIHHSSQKGQQASRMAGIAEVETEWVLFGEDDVGLGKNYIATLFREAQALGAKIIAGRIVNVRSLDDQWVPLRANGAEPHMENIFDIKRLAARFDAYSRCPLAAPFLHTIALIHRSVFTVVGFDPRYRGTAHREETDFYLSANTAGFSVYWTPSTECYHLRGAISLTGGQRGKGQINWLRIEFWAFVNTWLFIRKHWPVLSKKYGFEKNPLSWFVTIYCKDRFILYFDRICHGVTSKTWRNK